MRTILVTLIFSLISISGFSQKTIPIFTTINQLFDERISEVSDAIPILKRNGLLTDVSYEITSSQYSSTAKILKSVTYNKNFGTIVVEVTYDYNEDTTNVYAVSFLISKNYLNSFNGYLKKNCYKFMGEQSEFPWSRLYFGKHACSITDYKDGGFHVMFVKR